MSGRATNVAGRRPDRGFTLVELLVAMTLIGLMFVALFGGLRFGARVWEAGVERSAEFAEVEVTQALLRRQLDQLLPLPGLEEQDQEITFQGEQERLVFTAPAPTQFGLGGVYYFDLFAERADPGRRLVLRWQLYRPDRDEPFNDEESDQRTLLENVESVEFSYYGDPEQFEIGERLDAGEWRERWVGAALPPQLIAVRVSFPDNDRRYWPELIIAPRATTGEAAPQ